jgi:putative serine protease PepD
VPSWIGDGRRGVPIVTHGWPGRPGSTAGRGADWAYPSGAGTTAGPQPAATTWWSDALADPWRDPAAPAAVLVTSAAPASDLEPVADVSIGPRRGVGTALVIAIVTALLAGALGGTLGYVFAARGGALASHPLGGGAAAPGLVQRAPDSLAGVVKKVLPSVVTIKVRGTAGTSLGSGFIVSGDGYVVTNEHVVSGSSGTATITFSDATSAAAKVVGADPESDIAVLKLERANLPPVEFGDSDQVQVGDPVLAFGSPLALANTVTYGIVSAVDRPIEAGEPGGPTRYYAAIQTDAAVNHGNSGGPLVDAAGRVVGINSVIKSLASDQEEAGNVGLAFAIPINQAKRQAQEIIDIGRARRTVIGAEIEMTYENPNGGVRLSAVQSGGPAANAGLHAGDVIMRLDGRPLEEPGDLIALVRKYAPGSGVSVEYLRDGASRTTRVTLAADAK